MRKLWAGVVLTSVWVWNCKPQHATTFVLCATMNVVQLHWIASLQCVCGGRGGWGLLVVLCLTITHADRIILILNNRFEIKEWMFSFSIRMSFVYGLPS